MSKTPHSNPVLAWIEKGKDGYAFATLILIAVVVLTIVAFAAFAIVTNPVVSSHMLALLIGGGVGLRKLLARRSAPP